MTDQPTDQPKGCPEQKSGTPGPGSAIISARGLMQSFDVSGHGQIVLNDLSIDIRRGDFTVIMGPSGAGKSTLLYALAGLRRPTGGTIDFAGKSITMMRDDELAVFRRRNCGFVFQQHQLLERMSLMDNVIVAGALTMRSKRQIVEKSRELFALVHIDTETQKRTSAQVSGGEAQRASIVRALINDPALVFADEPTGALNSRHAKAVLDVFSMLHARGQSIVMVTHDRHSALRANRVLYLRDGVIAGECALGSWAAGTYDGREHKLAVFLEEMGW
ncbi:MAG: ABC transporter ATP-binding protein [Bifidobacterium animalis]|nr:ABC transporter ATP-binding protein [Bifidobacterium animalis]MDY5039908.1 ABC transporter ATP-binding protein [Bifidobacterium animalis]